MNWTAQTITIRERRFEAGVCRGSLGAVEGAYRIGVGEALAHGDAWFVRRTKDRRIATGETLNGVPLYHYESVPQELWRIKSCSLPESIEVARVHFGCPELKHCLHGEVSQRAIWTFLEREKFADRVRLSVVTEIALAFELVPGAGRILRSEAQRVMDFCLAEFKEASSAKERAMLIRGAIETGAFAIGSV